MESSNLIELLCVLLGDSLPMDVATLHQGDRFIKYNVSLLAYGYYGDVLIDSEQNRWMGPRRYDWAGSYVALVRLTFA